jgi:hypothetical protein
MRPATAIHAVARAAVAQCNHHAGDFQTPWLPYVLEEPTIQGSARRKDGEEATQFRVGGWYTHCLANDSEQTDCEVIMNQSGKQSNSEQGAEELNPANSQVEQHAKPSQAEGEREEPQPGEESRVADPHVQADTPPKPSQAEGEPDTTE